MAVGEASVGICAHCLHVRRVTSKNGPVYWLCGSPTQPLGKYPRIPVIRCPEFESQKNGDRSTED